MRYSEDSWKMGDEDGGSEMERKRSAGGLGEGGEELDGRPVNYFVEWMLTCWQNGPVRGSLSRYTSSERRLGWLLLK